MTTGSKTLSYYTVEEKSADEPLTKLQRAPGKTEIILRAGKPTEATDRWPRGLYYGACTLVDGTQKPAYWCFEVELPSEQFSDILESIRRDPTVQITVDVHLLSFVYEVDAALRNVDDPQDLFVETGTTAAAATSVSTSESFNQTDGIPPLPSSREVHSPSELILVAKGLKRMAIALWVLVGVIVYAVVR